MKKILLSMLMLFMSVLLISPDVHASGETLYTVYNFTGSETESTFNGIIVDDDNIPLNIIVFNQDTLVHFLGSDLNGYHVRGGSENEYYFYIFNENYDIVEYDGVDFYWSDPTPTTIIVIHDLDAVNTWHVSSEDTSHGLTALDLQRTTIFYNQIGYGTEIIYENGLLIDENFYVEKSQISMIRIEDVGIGEAIELINDGTIVGDLGTIHYFDLIIIEAAETTNDGLDLTGWTQDGTYYRLDDPTPGSGDTITVTSPFGNPLEYRLIVSGTTIQDWTVAPSTFQITMRIEMVGMGDFNHYLEITGDNYEDSFGPYLDPINYEGFEIRTSSLEVLPSGWFENNGYWFAEDPTPSPGETKTLVSPFGTPIEYRLRNGETVVKNWTTAPSSIDITLRVEFIALGDFNFYIDIVGVEFTDTLGPYMNSDVFVNGFEVRTNEPFVDASPIIDGQQYFTVSYHQPVTETAIRSNLYAWDEVDGNLTSAIQLVSDGYTANKNTVGTYEIKYRVTDSSNNTSEIIIYVMVVDQIAPVFHFGNDVVYQSYKVIRSFLTSTVNDAHDGPIPVVKVEDTYTPNWNIIGEYYITYTATDTSGNTATMTRTIIVVDDVPPVITGPTIITKSYNTILTTGQIMAQLTATDEIDGDVTDSFTVISSTYGGKSNVPGTYSIVFRAMDTSGNSVQRTVTIIVTDNIPPIWYATNNFLITLDQAVQLSTNQIINTLQLSGFITDTQASNLYVVSDEYQQTQNVGTYNLVFGVTGQSETLTVTLVVYNLSLEEPGMYTVSFNSNGGSFVPSVSTDGTPFSAPTSPTRTGYVFSGWYSDEALTTLYQFTSEVTADMTLYAKWTLSGGGITPPPATTELTTLQIVGIAVGGLVVLSIIVAALTPKKFGGRRR